MIATILYPIESLLKKVIAFLTRFVFTNILILILTFPLVVLYGPFTNVRNSVVGAVATSMHVNLSVASITVSYDGRLRLA